MRFGYLRTFQGREVYAVWSTRAGWWLVSLMPRLRFGRVVPSHKSWVTRWKLGPLTVEHHRRITRPAAKEA